MCLSKEKKMLHPPSLDIKFKHYMQIMYIGKLL